MTLFPPPRQRAVAAPPAAAGFAARRLLPLASLGLLALVSACSSSSPPTTAEPRTASVAGHRVTFGGTFRYDQNDVIITANGEQIMRYEFPPFTATARMHATYRGTALMADCYFSSILAKKRGPVGMIGRSVQGNVNKTTDTCRILQGEKVLETLNFPIAPDS